MRDLLALAGAGAVGAALGAVFFGGLWWTVREALTSRQPAIWFGGSLLVRTGIVMGGLYLVSGTGWTRLVACLMGFFAARLAVTRFVHSPRAVERVAVHGAHRAP